MTKKDVDADKPIRTSVIKKQIRRTLSTAPYETIVIEDGFEEVIEWKTVSERDAKIENWTTILLQGYKKSHDRILDELGLSHKKAHFKNPSSETQAKYKHMANPDKNPDKEPDNMRGLDLDNLETA